MQIDKCTRCGDPNPISEMYSIHGAPHCGNCLEDAKASAGLAKNAKIDRIIDPTICTACGKHTSDGEWSASQGVPLCDSCVASQEVSALPWWLKNCIVLFAILLVVALHHGWPYVRAVRDTYRAEKRMAHHKAAEAVPLLEPVVAKTPECDRCVVDLALAYVRLGRPAESYKLVKDRPDTDTEYSEDIKALHKELQAEYDKVDRAGELLDQVEKLDDEDKPGEARATLEQAKKVYPDWDLYPFYAREIDATEAWVNKDWDRLLAIREKESAENPNRSTATGALASALAAKFAATGDLHFKQQAMDKLALAQHQLQEDDDKSAFAEFNERMEHRLRTREILDRTEYLRRYHPERLKEEAKK